jgi:hypothetical protein
VTDEPKEPEDELEQAPPDRHQEEEAMRQAGHEDPERGVEETVGDEDT